ncbi:MAG: MBL fold metallo-hydrolase, partial [Pseudooceanicola nanhaiensis]
MDAPDDFDPKPGQAEPVAPGIRRVLCNNPSAFTYRGTNTYLLGA